MTPELEMRDKDLRRVVDHVIYHHDYPQTEPMRGNKIAWSYIRFARWALPILIHHGYIGNDADAPE